MITEQGFSEQNLTSGKILGIIISDQRTQICRKILNAKCILIQPHVSHVKELHQGREEATNLPLKRIDKGRLYFERVWCLMN